MKYKSYIEHRNAGATAEECYRIAKEAGLSEIESVAMLRDVYSLSIAEAKEVAVTVSTSHKSLDEYQASLAPKVLDELS